MTVFLISLLFGGFVTLISWQAYQVFHSVPDEDRSFLDRPAVGFRFVWPLIQAFVYYFGHYIGDSHKQITLLRLKNAGTEFSLSAEQFIAAKFVSSLLFSLFLYLFLTIAESSMVVFTLLGTIGGFFYPELWLKEITEQRRGAILKALPFYLDIITLSVEAGSNLTGGLTQAVQKSGDSPLRNEINRVLRDIRAGKSRADSLRTMAERAGSGALQSVVSAMIQAEKTGSSLGPILRAQAERLRSERFMRAEKLAMEAPVKLLGPLVMFIFPTTFLVLGFLVLSKALQEGLVTWAPIVWAYTWPG